MNPVAFHRPSIIGCTNYLRGGLDFKSGLYSAMIITVTELQVEILFHLSVAAVAV